MTCWLAWLNGTGACGVIGVVGVGGSEALGVAGAAALFLAARFARPPSFCALPFGGIVLLPGVGVGGWALANDGDSLGA